MPEEDPNYDEMPTKDLPWVLHFITRWPYNCHTHGLREIVGHELSVDAGDPLFVAAAGEMLNSIGRAVAGGKTELRPGTVFTYGRMVIPVDVSEGCTEHPDVEGYLKLVGRAPQCQACEVEGEAEPDGRFHRTVLVYEVLSEEPYEYQNLESLAYDVREGDCSGMLLAEHHSDVDAPQMAALLEAQGSEPGFFQIGEDDEFDDEEPPDET